MPYEPIDSAKPIRLSRHARNNAVRRGTSEEEISKAVREAAWQPAECGRQECRMDFPYGKEWNNKEYATKRVRPIFAEKDAEIVVVTVYVYYL